MKNIKYILISSIIIYGLNFPAHFVYDITKSNILGIFFPVNESIFQHMKMIYTTFFIFYLILFIGRRKFKLNNIILADLISSISTIFFFLIIYLPVYYRFGESMIFTFILLFISILFGQFISSFIVYKEEDNLLNISSFILIIIIFIILGYLTNNPPHQDLFWDPDNETYEKAKK